MDGQTEAITISPSLKKRGDNPIKTQNTTNWGVLHM